MESLISDLVSRFEKGSLSRRELVSGLAMLVASGTAASAAAQDEIDFSTANIDHVSMQVADLQLSVDFYQKTFGFTVASEERALGIVRLGHGRTLVSFNLQKPTGIVDHFSIGVPRFTKEAASRYFALRGLRTGDDPYHGLHVRDPDGNYVQVSLQR
jgi:catechol 2,3-dioxygenase-like lactoylglutathione lyase family enzyme